MKKYLLSYVAILLGLSLSSFNNSPLFFTDRIFRYEGSDYTEASVEDVSNWEHVSSSQGCPGTENKACEITVSPTYYHNVGLTYVLNTFAYATDPDRESGDLQMIIIAQLGADVVNYRVSGGTVVAINNKD